MNLDTANPLLNDVIHASEKDVIGELLGLRSLQKDLSNFSRILGEHVDSLRNDYDLQNLDAGINSIPPEILSQIFQHACSSDSNGIRFAFSLLQVCERFRVAALHTPAIWATVTDDLPPDWIKLCLARSASLPLTIRINDETHQMFDGHAVSSEDIPDFVSLICQAQDRWQSFTYFQPPNISYIQKESEIRLLNSEQFSNLQLWLLSSNISELALPALRTLSISPEDARRYHEECGDLFFSSWFCKQLASFHGHCALPYGIPYSFRSNTLTVCSLHIRNDQHGNYRGFPERLASLKNLKKLAFHLEIVKVENESQTNFLDWKYPVMNALEELHIVHKRKILSCEDIRQDGFDSVHSFKYMFSHMELPALKTLTCEFELEGNVFRNIQEAMPVASRCPNLRRLTLKHRLFINNYTSSHTLAENVTAGPSGLQSLFPLFPQIHYLELEGSRLCQLSSEMPTNASLPPLRAISITTRGNANKRLRFVLDLISHLKSKKCWTLFDTLKLKEKMGVLDYAQIRTQLGDKKLIVVN